MAEKRNGGTLKDVYVSGIVGNMRATGTIYGDSKWSDGSVITTSNIAKIDIQQGVIETKNTIYKIEKRGE